MAKAEVIYVNLDDDENVTTADKMKTDMQRDRERQRKETEEYKNAIIDYVMDKNEATPDQVAWEFINKRIFGRGLFSVMEVWDLMSQMPELEVNESNGKFHVKSIKDLLGNKSR